MDLHHCVHLLGCRIPGPNLWMSLLRPPGPILKHTAMYLLSNPRWMLIKSPPCFCAFLRRPVWKEAPEWILLSSSGHLPQCKATTRSISTEVSETSKRHRDEPSEIQSRTGSRLDHFFRLFLPGSVPLSQSRCVVVR